MSEQAWSGRKFGAELRVDPPRRPRPPAPWRGVAAAVVALAAAAGLAWWFAVPDSSSDLAAPPPPAPRPAPKAPVRYASPEPSPEQVRNAWRDAQTAYADGGETELVRVSTACASRVPADPTQLDYCLAFDVYASQIAPGGPDDWFGQAPSRDLALARAALPAGVDADNRISQVGALTRAVLPKSAPLKPPAGAKPQRVHGVAPPPQPKAKKAHAVAAPPARGKAIHTTLRKPSSKKGRGAKSDACANSPTEADRLVCVHAELASEDQRMQGAYNQAIASGVDPQVLGEQQEDWRAARDRARDAGALRELYRQRIEDLEALAPPH